MGRSPVRAGVLGEAAISLSTESRGLGRVHIIRPLGQIFDGGMRCCSSAALRCGNIH